MLDKIIIIRHGETDFNKERVIQGQLDTFLNKNGVEQARKAAVKLKGEKIDRIYTSDLKRANHTALIIGEVLKARVIPTPLLRERYFGELQGLRIETIKKTFWRFLNEVETSVSYGWFDKEFLIETDDEIEARFKKFFDSVEVSGANKIVAVVTHGGFIRCLLKVFGFEKKTVFARHIQNAEIIILQKRGNEYLLIGK